MDELHDKPKLVGRYLNEQIILVREALKTGSWDEAKKAGLKPRKVHKGNFNNKA